MMLTLPPPPPPLQTAPPAFSFARQQASPQEQFLVAPAPTSALLVVDKRKFRLKFYRRIADSGYELIFSYKIAVGAPGHNTPAGAYVVQRKAKNPSWTAPRSPWVPIVEQGKYFQPNSPDNPIVGAFLAIDGVQGLGIHGTRDRASLGTRASHGCIRTTRQASLTLFRRVPLGTPVVVQ